jgi:hypothetical protein
MVKCDNCKKEVDTVKEVVTHLNLATNLILLKLCNDCETTHNKT